MYGLLHGNWDAFPYSLDEYTSYIQTKRSEALGSDDDEGEWACVIRDMLQLNIYERCTLKLEHMIIKEEEGNPIPTLIPVHEYKRSLPRDDKQTIRTRAQSVRAHVFEQIVNEESVIIY
jgi:hypothetical protein